MNAVLKTSVSVRATAGNNAAIMTAIHVWNGAVLQIVPRMKLATMGHAFTIRLAVTSAFPVLTNVRDRRGARAVFLAAPALRGEPTSNAIRNAFAVAMTVATAAKHNRPALRIADLTAPR